jgi:hypothetical protein
MLPRHMLAKTNVQFDEIVASTVFVGEARTGRRCPNCVSTNDAVAQIIEAAPQSVDRG